jgi:hypothetical protein
MALVYRIDANDRLWHVGEGWDAFAAENGAPQLTRERVLGRFIFDFIAGRETQHLYGILLGRARAGMAGLHFPFRCDSPDRRRFLTMQLRRFGDTGVEFECTLDRIEPRIPIMMLDPRIARSDELIRMCSWCKRVEVTQDRWQDLESAIAELDLFRSEPLPQITHGICRRCRELVQAARDPA